MRPLSDCRLYTFVDTAYLHGRSVEAVARQLCEGGSDIIQLRAKTATPELVRAMAEAILPITRKAGVSLVINDYPEIACAVGAEFCHLGQEDFFDAGFTHVSQVWRAKTELPEGGTPNLPRLFGVPASAGVAGTGAGGLERACISDSAEALPPKGGTTNQEPPKGGTTNLPGSLGVPASAGGAGTGAGGLERACISDSAEALPPKGGTTNQEPPKGGTPNLPQVGLSTHAPDQAERALRAEPAYVAIGPVFATGTKPTAKPATLEYVRWAAAHVTLPWFAIGGITLETLPAVLAAGATRICVVSAILNAPDIAAACREFKRRL